MDFHKGEGDDEGAKEEALAAVAKFEIEPWCSNDFTAGSLLY